MVITDPHAVNLSGVTKRKQAKKGKLHEIVGGPQKDFPAAVGVVLAFFLHTDRGNSPAALGERENTGVFQAFGV